MGLDMKRRAFLGVLGGAARWRRAGRPAQKSRELVFCGKMV